MKTRLFLSLLLAGLSTGCVGVSYTRNSAADGSEQVRATATSLFTSKAFDEFNAGVKAGDDQRTLSISKYKSVPDPKSIQATGEAVGAAAQQILK